MLAATAVECIPMSATVSNDGALPCNKDCGIHYEVTTDAAQQVPPSPGMDCDPSATLESSTVLLSQEILRESPMQHLETLLSKACISHQRRIQLSR